jgi:hypothetical protein
VARIVENNHPTHPGAQRFTTSRRMTLFPKPAQLLATNRCVMTTQRHVNLADREPGRCAHECTSAGVTALRMCVCVCVCVVLADIRSACVADIGDVCPGLRAGGRDAVCLPAVCARHLPAQFLDARVVVLWVLRCCVSGCNVVLACCPSRLLPYQMVHTSDRSHILHCHSFGTVANISRIAMMSSRPRIVAPPLWVSPRGAAVASLGAPDDEGEAPVSRASPLRLLPRMQSAWAGGRGTRRLQADASQAPGP